MSGEEQILPPPVIWAQRQHVVFVTFSVEDCKSPEVKIEADKIYFKGVGGTEKKNYEITLNLYKEIDPEKSIKAVRDRNIELILKKKESDGYWPTLLKEKVKYHWLKVDFNKWKDEDDSEDEMEQSEDLESMMRHMGGLGGGDVKPNFDDLGSGSDSDSDDMDLPGLE